MTPEARLLFDECVPGPIIGRLADFIGSRPHQNIIIKHFLELWPSGTLDQVWVPQLKEQGWTVISADGARRPNKNRGKKLPRLCIENGITLVVLSPVVHRRKVFDKTRTILSVWDELFRIATTPEEKGKRYMLEPLNPYNEGVGKLSARPPRLPGQA